MGQFSMASLTPWSRAKATRSGRKPRAASMFSRSGRAASAPTKVLTTGPPILGPPPVRAFPHRPPTRGLPADEDPQVGQGLLAHAGVGVQRVGVVAEPADLDAAA